MRLIVDNVMTTVLTGGSDFLLPVNIVKELDNYLAIPIKDAYWIRKKNNLRGWDGKTHYFKSDRFPTGFLPMVLKFLVKNEVKVNVEDVRTNMPVFRTEFRSVFGEQELRGYQEEAVKAVNNYLDLPDGSKLFWPRGIIDAATNAGKNLITLAIMDNIEDVRALFIIHNKDIFAQAVEAFEPYYKVGQITSAKCDIQEVTVAMVKSLNNKLRDSLDLQHKLRNYFNIVILDESHHGGADEHQYVMKATNAGARVMVSGTALENEDRVANLNIIALSGNVLKKVSNKELIDQEVSAKPTIYLYRVTYPSKSRLYLSYVEVKANLLHKSEERMKVIIDSLRADILAGKQILITFLEMEHGYFMLERLKYLIPTELVIDIVHGQDPYRTQKIADYKKAKINILLTSSILKEGLNIPNIEVLCLAHGGKSIITQKQFMGRGLRRQENKTTLKVLDYYDDAKYLDEHSMKRFRLYQKEGFDIVCTYPNKNLKICKI